MKVDKTGLKYSLTTVKYRLYLQVNPDILTVNEKTVKNRSFYCVLA